MPFYISNDGYRIEVSSTSFGSKHTGGTFQGRTGGLTRSRKGRTTRLPNGSRRYIATDEVVIAYHAGSYVASAPNS